MRRPRSMEISSFTLIKGSLISETYAAFQAWRFDETETENYQRLRRDNTINSPTTHWLRDVAKVIHRRFDPHRRDQALVLLAQNHCSLETWKPILFWHMTRDEFLLRDFVTNWLASEFQDGRVALRKSDVLGYFATLRANHAKAIAAWSESTKDRLAGALLRIAADFGLLQGSVRKTFATYHLPDESFVYLLQAIAETESNARRIIESEDWRLFLMAPADVEQALFRLHQFQRLHYEVAGSLAQLTLPCNSALEFAGRLCA